CALLGCRFLVSVCVCLGWASTLGGRRSRLCFTSGCGLPGLIVVVLMSLVFVMRRLVCGLAHRHLRGDRRRAPGLVQDTQGLGSAFPRSRILHPHRPQDDPPQGNENKQEQRLPVHRLPPFCGGCGASETAPSGSPIKRSTSATALW